MNEFIWGSIGGVSSYIILNYILKPINEYKKIKREVFQKLIFYADIYTSHLKITGPMILTSTVYQDPPPEEQKKYEEAKTVLRQLSSEVISFTKEISFYKLLAYFNLLPKEEKIVEASKKILAISNRLIVWRGSKDDININTLNADDAEIVKELLN